MTFNWDADCRLSGWKIKWDSFICLETVDLLRWFYSDVDFDKYEVGTLDWFRWTSQVIPQNKDELTKTLDERQGYYNSLWSREKEDEMRGLHRLIRERQKQHRLVCRDCYPLMLKKSSLRTNSE